jgi:hypothetical protein
MLRRINLPERHSGMSAWGLAAFHADKTDDSHSWEQV